MPNATVRANAQAMPDRRTAFASLAATAALLAAPRAAKAAGDDADVFAAVERVRALRREQKALGERVSVIGGQLPVRPALLDHDELFTTRNAIRLFESLGVDERHPTLGGAFARAAEICRVEVEWVASRRAAMERLEYEAAEEACSDAAAATSHAASELLDLRPRTLAGLRALVATLLDANFLEVGDDGGETLARLILESPALAGEA
jgi:hypothetical protein